MAASGFVVFYERLPAAVPAAPEGAGRRFLLVTLPYGPFGGLLNRALRRSGADTRHMVFNAGDAVSRRGPGAVLHRGGVEAWKARLALMAPEFTDIVLFGESGPYNQAVLDRPRLGGPRLWVLENGYFRPDWITLEQGGANAAGRLPRTAAAYADAPPAPPPPQPVGPALRSLVLHISLYYLAEMIGRPLFPRHRTGFFAPPWRQAAGHVGRYLRQIAAGADRSEGQALSSQAPFFLICLQRDGDSQLLRHSALTSNAAFLETVLASFARAAPAGTRLVIKNHPLDHGVTDLRRLTRRLAAAQGLEDRVTFVEGGRLAALCRASRGLVLNNSSAGLSALGFGTPVKALGRAVFDFEGLTDPQPLDAFWRSPQAPDAELFARFRGHVLARTQINGGFEAPSMRRLTAEKAAARLMQADADAVADRTETPIGAAPRRISPGFAPVGAGAVLAARAARPG